MIRYYFDDQGTITYFSEEIAFTTQHDEFDSITTEQFHDPYLYRVDVENRELVLRDPPPPPRPSRR